MIIIIISINPTKGNFFSSIFERRLNTEVGRGVIRKGELINFSKDDGISSP